MTLIFDWDGTLHNTLKLYGSAFRIAYGELVQEGYAPDKVYSDEDVSVYLGMNTEEMWLSFMPDLPSSLRKRAGDRIGEEMVKAISRGEAALYEGIPSMLDRFKQMGHTMVILSNCKHSYMEAHRQYFELDRWFSAYYCCEDYNNAPKEKIFLQISKEFPAPYLMVGDRASDMKVAKMHHLPSIGCGYGFGAPEELRFADVTVSSCHEIAPYVERFSKASAFGHVSDQNLSAKA